MRRQRSESGFSDRSISDAWRWRISVLWLSRLHLDTGVRCGFPLSIYIPGLIDLVPVPLAHEAAFRAQQGQPGFSCTQIPGPSPRRCQNRNTAADC